MVHKEFEYITLAHLPTNLNCFVEASHSVKRERSVKYLGNQTANLTNPICNIEIFVTTDEDAAMFRTWYNDTLRGGCDPFTALHTIFGTTEHYVFQTISEVTEKIITGSNRKISFTAEIIGISYPNYLLIQNSNLQVLNDGSIFANVTPNDPVEEVEYNAEYFTIFLNSKSYDVETAIKINNVIYITPSKAITDYAVEVKLHHSTVDKGLIAFTETLINHSGITRATISGSPYTDVTGEYVYIILNREVTDDYWFIPDNDFTIMVGADTMTISETPTVIDNKITLKISSSRSISATETVTVSFNTGTNVEIEPFIDISVENQSEIGAFDANPIVEATVNTAGTVTIASMTIPQDRTYNPTNFKLEVDGTEYDIESVEQVSASLTVMHKFNITDYVTSVKLHHTSNEWGFAPEVFDVTNNSTLLRASVSSANINAEGTRLSLMLDNALGRDSFEAWLGAGGILSSLTLTADGTTIPIMTDAFGSTMPYTIYIEEGYGIYDGETVLLSYTNSTDIELAPFTDVGVANYSEVIESMHIVSAVVSTDGLTITTTMNISETVNYTPASFTINNSYLEFTPTSTEQVGTTLTIGLTEPMRSTATVSIDHDIAEGDFGIQLGVNATNNSTVVSPEFVLAQVVTTGTYILLTMDEQLYTHAFTPSDFAVKIGGVEREVISANAVDGIGTVWIYPQGTIYSTDTVTLAFTNTGDPLIDDFTDTSVTNNSTQTDLPTEPPIYNMTEDLVEWGGFYWLVNSSPSGSAYRGKLCRDDGTTWSLLETTTRYLKNGTIDLSGGYYIDTQWIASPTETWAIGGLYNVESSVYDMYWLDYDGVDSVDIYLYNSEDDDVPEVPTYESVLYTPPTETWKIYEEAPSIINTPTQLVYDMSNIFEELGTNLITNSTFDTVYTPWYAQSANTVLSVVDSTFKITGDTLDEEQFAEIEISGLAVGEWHKITLDALDVNTNSLRLFVNTIANDNTSAIGEFGYSDIYTNGYMWVKPTATTMYLSIGDEVGSASVFVIIDNIELRRDYLRKG